MHGGKEQKQVTHLLVPVELLVERGQGTSRYAHCYMDSIEKFVGWAWFQNGIRPNTTALVKVLSLEKYPISSKSPVQWTIVWNGQRKFANCYIFLYMKPISKCLSLQKMLLYMKHSLVPRPHLAFRHLQYGSGRGLRVINHVSDAEGRQKVERT